MDASQLPSSVSAPQEASHYDELSMKQSLNFSDSLKDLKDLRKQLYSAADSFELSYNRHDQKQTVVKTLRDYATKVFINTVDHLGSMIYKVKCLLEDKIEEASAIELRFSCVRQRLRMCEMFIDRGGLSQRSLVIRTPKHHMRYILPGTLPFTRFVIGLLRPRVRNRLMLKNFLSVSTAKDGGASKNLRYHMTSGVNAEMSAGEHASKRPDADSGTLMQETAFGYTVSTILPSRHLSICKHFIQQKTRKTRLPISISIHMFRFSGQ
ncbi:protein ABIL3-like isoform X4 [Syzygium oleosum]|uniref:protein ABIL3-like isoform X4 n=1 Tax=Syzygium oleosum TaxID=219896 RepID=UPI0024BADCA7|nr:protein ABIL3-like isoform X4 [Syzygium oleosum]